MSTKNLPKATGVSAFRSTKREPDILNALLKLWDKMNQLQEARKNEKQDAQTGANDSNGSETLSDIQYRLLDIQLKYIQKIVHKHIKDGSNSDEDDELDLIPSKLEKETQTSLAGSAISSSAKSNKAIAASSEEREIAPVQKECEIVHVQKEQVADTRKRTVKVKSVRDKDSQVKLPGSQVFSTASGQSSSQGHYHMKLTDVPFLIGKSTTASHSVIANVQNVIGMMKSHNKGLCKSPAHGKSQETVSNRNLPVEVPTTNRNNAFDMMELKRMMKHLTEELQCLTMQQELLRRKLNNLQLGKDKADMIDKYNNISKDMETKAKDIVVAHNRLKKMNSDKPKEKVVSKVKARPKSHTSRPTSSNVKLTGSTNQRFMKSVKQLKTRLQEGDVDWS